MKFWNFIVAKLFYLEFSLEIVLLPLLICLLKIFFEKIIFLLLSFRQNFLSIDYELQRNQHLYFLANFSSDLALLLLEYSTDAFTKLPFYPNSAIEWISLVIFERTMWPSCLFIKHTKFYLGHVSRMWSIEPREPAFCKYRRSRLSEVFCHKIKSICK